jgi:hypothetical protein
MTDSELEEKFRECAAWGGLGRAEANKVLELAWKIEELEDVGALTRLVRRKVP